MFLIGQKNQLFLSWFVFHISIRLSLFFKIRSVWLFWWISCESETRDFSSGFFLSNYLNTDICMACGSLNVLVCVCMKHYSLHSLCGHGLHFHKTHHSDTLRSNVAQRTGQTQRMNPIAFIWAIYSHPSLWVWSVGNQERLVNSSAVSLSPSWWVEELERGGDEHAAWI